MELIEVPRGIKDHPESTSLTTVAGSKEFTRLIECLKKEYANLAIQLPSNKEDSLEKLFVNQQMVKYDPKTTNTETLQLENLFSTANDQPMTRILVEGDAGFGKSVLATKLAVDWTNGREYISSQFEAVLLIQQNQLKKNNLENILANKINAAAIDDTKITQENLSEFLTDKKVLLIVDGFDELTAERRHQLQPILLKKNLRSTCIILTSKKGFFAANKLKTKASSCHEIESEDPEVWDERIVLNGFSGNQRKSFFQAHFNIDPETIQTKLSELFGPKIDEIFKCPVFAFWVGWMLEAEPKINDIGTKTAFFKKLISFILIRENKVSLSINEMNAFWNDMSTPWCKEICHLGNVALDQLHNHGFSFTESDVECSADSSAVLTSAIFAKCQTSEEKIRFRSMHQSFTDFFAAYSVSCNFLHNGDVTELKNTIRNLMIQGIVPSIDSLFYPFLAGLIEGNKLHALFDSIARWGSIYHVCTPEMANIIFEITNINDDLISSLGQFVTSFYKMLHSDLIPTNSDVYRKLAETYANKQMITNVDWDVSCLNQVKHVSSKLKRIYLRPSNDIPCYINWCKIRCNELISYIHQDMNAIALSFHFSLLPTIDADQYHLLITNCNSSTCTLILDKVKDMKINFDKVRFLRCSLCDDHLAAIIDLLQSNRIKKAIHLHVSDGNETTTDMLCQLWKAVRQSSTISEFTLMNLHAKMIPDFDLSPEVDRKVPFEMIGFTGFFLLNQSDANAQQIKELTIRNVVYDNTNILKILENVGNVRYLECYDHLFSTCLSSNLQLLATMKELFLVVHDNFTLPPEFPGVLDKMQTLTSLTLNLQSYFSQQHSLKFLAEFATNISKLKELKFLGLYFINSAAVFECLLQKLSNEGISLECLELIFSGDWVTGLSSNAMDPAKTLLKQQRLKRLAIVDWEESIGLRSIFPSMFPEKEFRLKCEIHGDDQEHSTCSKQFFARFMIIRDRFYVEFEKFN